MYVQMVHTHIGEAEGARATMHSQPAAKTNRKIKQSALIKTQQQ